MTRSIGIDLGASKIKIAEIEFNKKQRSIVGLYEIPRKEGMSDAQLLKEFFQTTAAQGERVAVGIGPAPTVVRHVSLPFNDKRVAATIYNELEDSIPFELENHVIDSKALRKQGKMWHFLAGLCPESVVQKLNDCCEEAGLHPNGFFIDSEALAHLALNQCLDSGVMGDIYAVCDIGLESTKLAILRGCNPDTFNLKDLKKKVPPPEILEIRTISRGANDLITWIEEKNKLSREETEQWIRHRAEIKIKHSHEISDEIKTALRPLMVEIYQTFQSIRARESELPAKIYLTGPLTLLKGFVPFVSHELRVNSEKWSVFQNFDLGSLPAPTPEKEQRFASAIALAHRYIKNKVPGWLNFRRSSQAKRKILTQYFEEFFDQQTRPMMLFLLAAVVFSLGYRFVSGQLVDKQMDGLKFQINRQFTEIDPELGSATVKISNDVERSREKFLSEVKFRSKNLDKTHPRAPLDILKDLSDSVPPGLRLKSLFIDRSQPSASFRAQLDSPGPLADQNLKEIQTKFDTSLLTKGYEKIRVDRMPNTKNMIHLKAKWKGNL